MTTTAELRAAVEDASRALAAITSPAPSSSAADLEIAALVRSLAELRLETAPARLDAREEAEAAAVLRLETAQARLDAHKEQALRVEAETDAFLVEMRNFADSLSPDISSHADVAWRGAPVPVLRDAAAVLDGLPLPARDSASRAWAEFAHAHAREWAPPPPEGKELAEIRGVHASVSRLLAAVVARDALRVWREGYEGGDDVPTAKVGPDFILTHVRDAGASTVGAAVAIEVKLPGCIDSAVAQLCAFLRRRVYKLCCERRARGEPIDDILALGAATDGCSVVLVRMLSGAPAPGAAFKGAKPCPSLATEPLGLLYGWDFRAVIDFSQFAPPAGVAALAHLCGSAAALGAGAPLTRLLADVTWAADGPGSAGDVDSAGGGGAGLAERRVVPSELTLGARLGSGGSSDAYELLELSGGVAGGALVVKVARCLTAEVAAGVSAEERALTALRGAATRAGIVPELVGAGSARTPDARVGAHGGGAWPVLVLRPRGMQLSAWVSERAAAAPRQARAAARRAAASAVVSRLLDAIAAAAAAGIVHCDVRPANIVVVGGAAMLVDWGCSCARGAEGRGRGVAAFADSRVFSPDTASSFAARPAQDVAGALLTWVAVACDAGCSAPWLAPRAAAPTGGGGGSSTVADMLARREAWLAAAAERGDVPASLLAALASAAKTGAGEDADAGIFALARAAIA